MLRVLIVEDEPLARRALHRLLQPHAVQIVGEAEGIRDAAELVLRLHPDLIFLDIELNGGDGFDLLAALENPPKVVFVTAYPAHAVEAFSVEAVDYLLKPVAPERLAEALERVRRQLAQRPDRTQEGLLELRTPNRSVLAAPSDIAALKADGDFTRILLADQPALMIWRTLGHFEQLLPVPPFLRLDRSLMINRERLRQIEARSRDEVRLLLSGLADPLVIGRTAAARLREATAGQRL
ncbi:MAG: two-component system response regulator [Rhizobiales bacterium 17-65-6]|nr:MAG: two-component system response regulator [Rhizobiales bacterium 12-68-15]OYX88607.1 MAG: two-component system response regulator [Azorhizobium sp. 32-67-21]OYY13533.1 MAG: two-component system response regulator [Rhizobiales bacterium 35-68-8]OYZ97638.1 MAG: two-component system response regulator [Rhizobiales bacterium 17-65-6]